MSHSERDETRLAHALQTLAEIEATAAISPRVEAAVLSAWDAKRTPRPRRRYVVRGIAVAAAAIALVSALAWRRDMREPAGVDVVSGSSRTIERYTTVAVVGGPLMAGEPIRVVRMRVARSVLGELGIPSAAHAETVDIDVLVAEDGVARAVRVPIEAGL